jgi:hypothetical protein
MPFEMLGPKHEDQPEMMPLPNPPKLGVIQTSASALISDYRVATIWVAIMERDPAEAREKLLSVIKNDIGATPPPSFEVPCIVKEGEGKNYKEKAAIRRAQRRQAMAYASLVDKLVRYRPESREYAWEGWDIDQDNRSALWRPYVCDVFRKTEKPSTPKNGKKKAMEKLTNIEAEG